MKSLILLAMAAILGGSVRLRAQDDQNKTQADQGECLVVRSTGVAEALKIHDQAPRYPAEAVKKAIQGDVVLLATIDTKGKISKLRIAKGDPILVEAAVTAVKHWRYKPYLLKGKPVEIETPILIKFHL